MISSSTLKSGQGYNSKISIFRVFNEKSFGGCLSVHIINEILNSTFPRKLWALRRWRRNKKSLTKGGFLKLWWWIRPHWM